MLWRSTLPALPQRRYALEVHLPALHQRRSALEVRLPALHQRRYALEVRLPALPQRRYALEVRLPALPHRRSALEVHPPCPASEEVPLLWSSVVKLISSDGVRSGEMLCFRVIDIEKIKILKFQ